jgi:REP element-mobilizing transposase RayT
MRRLNGDYARRSNKRHGRRGHLFEERFSSHAIRDERHLSAAVAYVLQNPVQAGLCTRPQEWQWSAASAFG